jgi:hypothetical protein
MMSAAECRAKAREALTNAERASDPKAKLDWGSTAREWTQLSVTAEVQEVLERELLDRISN